MIESIRDFLGDISGYRPRYLSAIAELQEAREATERLTAELNEAKEKIRQLELMLPRPAPQPVTYIVEKDSLWLQHEIDSMELGIIRFVLDAKYRLTNQTNFLNIVAWDWTDRLPYIKERFDCENFAILFKAVVDLYFELNQVAVILDYESGHGYNLVVYPDGNKSVLEPQSDGLYVWTKRPETFYSLKAAIALI